MPTANVRRRPLSPMRQSSEEYSGTDIRKGYALVAGVASIVTVTILIAIKGVAWYFSGSVSVLASLIDSLMDAVVSFVNFMAIRYSLKPADHEHRYGHGKIEGIAALFQSAFIAGAGIFLILESVRRFVEPGETGESMLAVGIMAVSIVLSLALVFVQKISLRYAPSLAVEAEQAHYAGDIVINLGVIAVLAALQYGAPSWLDPAFAVLVACYLGYTAKTIAMKGVDMLLDRELPDEMRQQILEMIAGHSQVKGVHELRTRKSGMDIHIAFDLELDPDITLHHAHGIGLAIERKILQSFPHAQIMIHKDPAGIPHEDSRHKVSDE